MTLAIDARDLVKDYGSFRAVSGVSFAIEPGEIYGFLGPNGAGKTTTLRMLCGLLEPTSGTSVIGGHDVVTDNNRVKGLIGYMSQAFGLYRDLTVAENLYFYGRLYLSHEKATRRRREVLARVGLLSYGDRLARALSGGWRQRLALGCALLHQPQILFLDEPTAGIDPVSRRDLWDLLYDLVHEGLTLFVTTHYMEEAERCNRIGFIARGKLLASDSPRRLKLEYLKGGILSVRCDEPVDLYASLRHQYPEISLYGNEIHVVADDPAALSIELDQAIRSCGWTDFSVKEIPPSIEDVFVHLTRQVEE